MDPDELNAVKSTFAEIAPKADLAAELFYGRLFEIAPKTRALFKEDMAEQKQALMKMLAAAVAGLDDIDALVPVVQELGRRHAGYGARPEHYPAVGEALIWTLEQGLGDGFGDEARNGWTNVYALLSKTMIEAAETVQ